MGVTTAVKSTELGLIPNEWDLATLEEISDSKRGICYGIVQVGRFFPDGVSVLAIKNLNTDYSTNIHRCAPTIEQSYARSRVAPGDILISVKGTTGRVGLVPDHYRGNISRDIARLGLTSSDCPQYWYQQLQSESAQRRLSIATVGTTRLELSIGILKQVRMIRPPKDEQEAIAAALSDVDALLTALDRLVAKKRDLQQAAMQQLLTGQIRLPDFGGNWETKRLGDHVAFLRNGTHSRAELDEAGPLRYLHYGDIHTASSCVLDAKRTAMPRLPETEARTLDRLESGDVVFVDASEDLVGVGKAVELRVPQGMQVVAGLHTIAARFDKLVLADGFKAYLQFVPVFRKQLIRLAAGTKVYATSRRHIADVTMPLPSPAEQVAIATVLEDMDAELTALEQRRDKTRLLKQGMMQELLTGRTRLV